MRRPRVSFVAAAVVVALSSCGGDSDSAQVTTPTYRVEASTTAPPATSERSAGVASTPRCTPVSDAKLADIAGGLTVDGGGSLRFGMAVKSQDFESVYLIAADIEGAGMNSDDDIGVWASNSLEAGQGLVLAVDGLAQEFSDWGDGDKTEADVTMDVDGADEARDCARSLG